MKIKKIIDLCKKRGIFRLYAGGSVQWISDGCALYPLYNLPEFVEETLYRVFDITEKQQDKISFRYELHLPSTICNDDYMQGEALCEKGTMVIGAGGKSIIPFKTSQGVLFIDEKYLAPLEDTRDYIEVYERTGEGGRIYFAVKSGFMLLAIVLPYDAINELFVNGLKELSQQCEIALFNKRTQEKQAEQQTIFGTGEEKTQTEEIE